MIKGLYIHIPFCNIKCPYCDFTSIVEENKYIYEQYVNAILEEITFYLNENFLLKTIYFGGGTPSMLPPKLLNEIINFVKENLKTEKKLEITIEVNPNTYRYEEFLEIKESGVNRVSIGNQSFLEKNLISLGRNHIPKDTFETVESALKAGIKNISLDLIYGIQNQTLEDLKYDLEIYTSLPITHISAYMLTAYSDTPLGKLVKAGNYELPDENTAVEMFEIIDKNLEENGFERYELSNWAKNGYQCKHNLLYWTNEEFLGVGVSSWSYINGKRFGNTKNINDYINKIKEGKKPVLFLESITDEEIRKEKIMLGLRLKEGIQVYEINNKMDLVEELIKEGFAKVINGRFVLTPKGLMVSNSIASTLI